MLKPNIMRLMTTERMGEFTAGIQAATPAATTAATMAIMVSASVLQSDRSGCTTKRPLATSSPSRHIPEGAFSPDSEHIKESLNGVTNMLGIRSIVTAAFVAAAVIAASNAAVFGNSMRLC